MADSELLAELQRVSANLNQQVEARRKLQVFIDHQTVAGGAGVYSSLVRFATASNRIGFSVGPINWQSTTHTMGQLSTPYCGE